MSFNHEDASDIDLIWPHKSDFVLFDVDDKNSIQNVKWINKKDLEALEIQDSTDLISYNLNKKQISNGFKSSNTIFHGNPYLICRALSKQFESYPESKKIQSMLYCPPIQLQDPSYGKFTQEQFISFSRNMITCLHKMIKDGGFVIVHTFELNYSKIKIILDEIFGNKNHIATFIWKKSEKNSILSFTEKFTGLYYEYDFDYILLYSKDVKNCKFNKFPPSKKIYKNPDNDLRGLWESRPLIASEKSDNEKYTYKFKNGVILSRKFRFARSSIERFEKEDRLHYTNPGGGKEGIPRLKIFYKERLKEFNKSSKGGYHTKHVID